MGNGYKVDLEDLAYIQITRTLLEIDKEFLFLLLGKRPSPRKIVVEEVLFPFQEIGAATCKITEEGILEMNKVMDRIVGWGHSHDDFGAFHSPTDKDTGNMGGNIYTPFASITVSKKGDWDTRVFTESSKEDGLEAELWLPEVVPKEKFKEIIYKYKYPKVIYPAQQGFYNRPWYEKWGDKLRGRPRGYDPYEF